jgi:phosphoenolpyruvate carboxylase
VDLSDSIRLLGDILGDVLRAQESEALFETEERIRALAKARRADEPLMDGDPVIQRSVHLRNPYVDPLNYVQIEMLRRLRALPDAEGSEAEACRAEACA